MGSTIFHFATIEVELKTGIDIRDITHDLNRMVDRSGIENETADACVVGSIGSSTERRNGTFSYLGIISATSNPFEPAYDQHRCHHCDA
jgi:hypothetical protein